MAYNPNIHHRRSIRLSGYDYSQSGAYFITICCDKSTCRFGEIVRAGFTPVPNDVVTEIILNEFGKIAYQQWEKLPERFTNMELDVFQIMPNHMHGIIRLADTVWATLAVAHNNAVAQNDMVAGNDMVADETRAGQALPHRKQKPLGTLLVHINHWWEMIVWKYSQKNILMK